MTIKNKPAAFFTLLIFLLLGLILYENRIPFVEVVIQAGHEGRLTGNTGAQSAQYREETWNILVANHVAKKLQTWGIEVKRMPAKVERVRTTLAVAIHFDGANIPCNSGASVGYPNQNSYHFAQRWREAYSHYFPFTWHEDNFTENLKHYYAYSSIKSEKFLIVELGEITCKKQREWLKPRLEDIASLLAYSIAKELGKSPPNPSFKD
jgi:N-acetylmuramoyl-L-alanine amidase